MSQTLSTKSICGTLKKNHTKDSSLAPESRVAARLGLTRVVCAALRREHLKLQVDYVKERCHRSGCRAEKSPRYHGPRCPAARLLARPPFSPVCSQYAAGSESSLPKPRAGRVPRSSLFAVRLLRLSGPHPPAVPRIDTKAFQSDHSATALPRPAGESAASDHRQRALLHYVPATHPRAAQSPSAGSCVTHTWNDFQNNVRILMMLKYINC